MLLPVLLMWFENSVQTLLPSADLCCSLVSFLAPVCCSMTSLTGKIAYKFISTGGFGDFVGLIFLMNLHGQIMRLPAFPLHFQLSPQNETCPSFGLLSGAALVRMCHDVLGCIAGCWSCPWLCCFDPFSVKRKRIKLFKAPEGNCGRAERVVNAPVI